MNVLLMEIEQINEHWCSRDGLGWAGMNGHLAKVRIQVARLQRRAAILSLQGHAQLLHLLSPLWGHSKIRQLHDSGVV